MIQSLRRTQRELTALGEFDWRRLEHDLGGAQKTLRSMEQLSIDQKIGQLGFWRTAEVVGLRDPLSAAVQELSSNVVDLLDPSVAPRVSSFREPAVRWDRASRRWKANTAFPQLSRLTGYYHEALGRLFSGLRVPELATISPALEELEVEYAERQRQLHDHLEARLDSWADNWLVFRLPDHLEITGRSNLSLAEQLQRPLSPGAEATAPADLWQLMLLSRGQAARLGKSSQGCHPREYFHQGVEYYRLDCHAYEPGKDGAARLRIEMRLVYRVYGSQASDTPLEVFFLFPVPSDREEGEYLERVMAELASAIDAVWDRQIRTDLGGSLLSGFSLFDGKGAHLRVRRPRPVVFMGDQKAIEVRAEWVAPPAPTPAG